MKLTKIAISILSIAAFSACGNQANTTVNNTTANKANNTIVVTNANSTNTNSTNTPNTNTSASKTAPTGEDARFKGDYMVGDVKCTVKPDSSDVMHEIKCADKDKVQNYSRDDAPPKAVIVSSDNEKVRFVFDDAMNLANGNFTDDKGKTVKVTRVK